jgi:DNA-binding transcriptional MerR regulator
MFLPARVGVECHRAGFAKVLHTIHVPPQGARTEPPGNDPAAAAPEGREPAAGSGQAAPEDAAAEAAVGPALSVAGAARGLGVAAATLRSWERRYGLAPSLHTRGGHRRYGPADLARLQVMHRLVREGVPPAEAARVAIRARIDPDQLDGASPYAGLLGSPVGTVPSVVADGAPGVEGVGAEERAGVAQVDWSGSAGGGRVLPMPRRSPTARGLARAAMALDSYSCHRTVESALAERGAVATWEELIRPVLVAVGDRWAETGRGVEIEHSFSAVVAGALAAHAARLARPRNGRPVVLASVPEEMHDLPLVALQAALADEGIRSHVIGARTPPDALADATLRLGPPVVFLWSQMRVSPVPDLPPMRPSPAVVVGGPGWAELPDAVVRTGDLAEAVGAVRAAMGL